MNRAFSIVKVSARRVAIFTGKTLNWDAAFNDNIFSFECLNKYASVYNTLRTLAHAVYRDFSEAKIENLIGKNKLIFLIFLLKTLILGTR